MLSGYLKDFLEILGTAVMPEPGGPGGPLALQYLAAQLNQFQPVEGRLSSSSNTGPPKLFHLPTLIGRILWKFVKDAIFGYYRRYRLQWSDETYDINAKHSCHVLSVA